MIEKDLSEKIVTMKKVFCFRFFKCFSEYLVHIGKYKSIDSKEVYFLWVNAFEQYLQR